MQATSARRRLAIFIVLPALLALATALGAEYGLGVVGCDLCVWQRWPYGTAAAVGSAALLRPTPAVLRIAFALSAFAFALACGLAVYHVGIQQGWWSEQGLCAGTLATAPADLRTVAVQLRPSCDTVDWSILGLSLAGLNALYAAAMTFAAVTLAARSPRPRTGSGRPG